MSLRRDRYELFRERSTAAASPVRDRSGRFNELENARSGNELELQSGWLAVLIIDDTMGVLHFVYKIDRRAFSSFAISALPLTRQ